MRWVPFVAIVALALAPALSGLSGAAPASFTYLDIPRFGGEPNLEVAPDGTVYVVHPDWPGSHLWRRAPGAASFTDLGLPNFGFGGGDEDVAVGPGGLVAVAGMYHQPHPSGAGWCTSITVSRDGGSTFAAPVPAICALPRVDRPYVEIDELGAIWVLQHAYCCQGQHSLHYSLDGVTFVPAGVASAVSNFPGNLVAANGRLFAASGCSLVSNAVCAASTATNAPQPVWTPAAPLRSNAQLPGLGHSTIAVDDAGHMYVAYPTSMLGSDVRIARSTDGGMTWGASEKLSVNAATMPWVVAGAQGRVAVAWYEADRRGDPNAIAGDAAWNVHLAVRTAWDEPWQKTVVSPTPNHYGPLCVNGAACHAQGIDRDLLDYFEVAAGPDGTIHLVWSDDVLWRVRYAEMTGGPRLR